MSRMKIRLFLIIFLLLVIQKTMCKNVNGQPSLNYYFGSRSINPDYSDNEIIILVNNTGSAFIHTRLHAIAKSPPSLGSVISLPVPYSLNHLKVLSVKINNVPINYTILLEENNTVINLAPPETLMEAFIQIDYIVDEVYSQGHFNFRFLSSSKITELTITVNFPVKENIWIVRDSVEFIKPSTEDDTFVIQKDIYPIIMNIVLCNINQKPINLVCDTTSGPYSLVNTPFIALGMGVIPVILISLIYNAIKYLSKKMHFSIFSFAYRNLLRRKNRSYLTIIGVAISVMLLILIITQKKISQEMLGPNYIPKMEWYWVLTLIITVIVSSFQIINCLYSSIMERYKEYGVMKAIGFSPRYIIKMVTIESIIIGLIAGLIGSLFCASFIIVSSDSLYGESPKVFSDVMYEGWGGPDIESPWIRNNILSFVLVLFVGCNIISYTISSDAPLLMVLPVYSYLIFLRPYDPFTLERFFDIAPFLTKTCIMSAIFSTLLSGLMGISISHKAGQIKPAEAFRNV